MFIEKFQKKLDAQKELHLYRKPHCIEKREGKRVQIEGRSFLNFASNDYLGISTDQSFAEQVGKNFITYGTSSASSRLVAGNYNIITEAEKAYAAYFGYEDALFYPSGFQANMGLISTLFEAGDHLFFDKHVHASTVKGIQLSGADISGYKHNQFPHLEKRIRRLVGVPAAVLTESLFSMDGDQLNVAALKALKEKYQFLTLVDEAHAIGVLGDKGRGIAQPVADIAIGTFGKALALFGAVIFLPTVIKAYLLNFSAPLIYTTTLPEAHAASAIALLDWIEKGDSKREHLQALSQRLKTRLLNLDFKVQGDAHIIAIEVGAEERCMAISKRLFEKGYFVFSARYPTVPMGKSILRLSLTAHHSFQDIDTFVDDLQEIQNECTA